MSEKRSKRAFWRNHIDQQQASGLSQRAYCEHNGLKLHQMVYWRHKILSEGEQVESSSGFVAIPLANRRGDGLSVSLPSGILVSGFCTVDDVARLLKVLA